ncbi:MAG: response regulator [Anaerolineae bacterium]|nr:response regulator [Anaerolineae bacterium]
MAHKRILVVDDERLTRISLVDFLADMGFETVSAADGESAIALQRDRPFDFCIIDIRMPGIDGVETIITLHRIDARSRFFVCTGSPQFALSPVLKQIGLQEHDVVFKPVLDMRVFVDLIAQVEGVG